MTLPTNHYHMCLHVCTVRVCSIWECCVFSDVVGCKMCVCVCVCVCMCVCVN